MQPPGKGLKTACILYPGHLTKMAAMPVYGKTFKNLPVHNHWAGCLETLYIAFRELVVKLYKW